MRRALALTTIVIGMWAAVAAADGGGPSPGISFGPPGIISHDGKARFVAFGVGRTTLVEKVGTRGGNVRRWSTLTGLYGVPMVAWDGSTDGLARSGHRLVLVSAPPARGPAMTRFVVLDSQTLRIRARLWLPGTWALDALSPGGSLLYLIQYLGVPGNAGQRYAVRALNVNTRRLYPSAIVDRREPDEKMTGTGLTRARSGDGAWAYTLYARANKGPFVHALDTLHRRAFCVDLPWRSSPNWLWSVRMRVVPGKLELRRDGRTIATVDTRTFEVSR